MKFTVYEVAAVSIGEDHVIMLAQIANDFLYEARDCRLAVLWRGDFAIAIERLVNVHGKCLLVPAKIGGKLMPVFFLLTMPGFSIKFMINLQY
jgi:hypothetical protein